MMSGMKEIWQAFFLRALLATVILAVSTAHMFEADGDIFRTKPREPEAEEADKDDDNDTGLLKEDEFDAVVFEAKDTDLYMELPRKYEGAAALYRTKKRILKKGFVRKERRRWYWVSKDDESEMVRITLGEADNIQLVKGRRSLEELFPELVYDIKPTHEYKQGDKIYFYGRIYGNKNDQYKIVFGKEAKILYTSKNIILSNNYILRRSIKLSLLLDPGEYYVKLYIDGMLTKELKIAIEAREEEE